MGRSETVDYIAMGKRVRKYREAKGWTQSDLAYEVHMSNTTISHIEVGSGKPELNTVVRIANALDVTVDMLLCESIKVSDKPYKYDLTEFMCNCSAEELRLLTEFAPTLIESFRRSIKKFLSDNQNI